jgi:hypothetical protein
MRIEIEHAEHLFGELAMLENIIRPQPALIFIRDLFNEDVTELLEVPMHCWISADDRDSARETI